MTDETDEIADDPTGTTTDSAHEGPGVVNAAFAGTGALIAAAGAGVASPDSLGALTAVVAGALFAVGVVAFLWGYANGVVRSREEKITLGGLFFLSHTAPAVVRFRLRAALGIQVVVAVIAASVRPYTAVAFAVLAPMYGLGLLALWGARFGTFFPRDDGRDG
ncbi:hypothetical protein [Actinospongicola halichondriae]|uniref:hypothetical protein n=1 Tax=Actinospongicola halichondriae TaxID=3236844 RepID=UPI003D4F8D8C